jgi:hypothetical protein
MNVFLKVFLILFIFVVVMSIFKVILDRFFDDPNGDDPKEHRR